MSDLLLAARNAERLKKMRRGVLLSARAIHNGLLAEGFAQWESNGRWGRAAEHEFRCALLTLTYAPDVEWKPSQVRDLLQRYRVWAKRNKCRFSYVWVMELHKSGVPHYHVVFWVSGGKTPPFPDEQGWWPHGKSNAVWATSPVGYIAKYASKGSSADVPGGARMWGAGGLTLAARAERSWCLSPKWLRGVTEPGTLIRKAKVVIDEVVIDPFTQCGKRVVSNVMAWVSAATGMAFFSPWEFAGFGPAGIELRHRGFIECFAPGGDYFRIAHTNPMRG